MKAESALVIASRDMGKAYEDWDVLPESIIIADSVKTETRRANHAQATASAERREKHLAISQRDEALLRERETNTLHQSKSKEVLDLTSRLEGAQNH